MKMILGIGVLGLVACAVGAWYWSTGADKPPQLVTVPVEQGDLVVGVSATGTVEPVEVIDVGAQIIGRVKSFGPDPKRDGKAIDFSSRVSKGDLLAQLDDSSLLNELDRARANVRLAEAELLRHQAQIKQATKAFERAESLRRSKSFSSSEFEEAAANLDIAKADVAVGNAKLEQAKLAKKEAEIKLGYATIKSPIDGVVIDRRVDVGQTVVAGLNAPSLFLMARDLSKMQVLAAVNEADIGDIRAGQKVTFRVDAYRDSTFAGKVSQIRLNAGMSYNVVSYDVVVDIDNANGKLLPYMTANVKFEVARQSGVMKVPNQALSWRPPLSRITPAMRDRFGDDSTGADSNSNGANSTRDDSLAEVESTSPTVWVPAADGMVQPVRVTVGLTDGVMTEVVDGELTKGMAVVVNTKQTSQKDFVSSFISKVAP